MIKVRNPACRKGVIVIEQMEEIQYLVRSLGIGATYRGYRYLIIAVDLCLRDEDFLLGISKVLYPKIAEICHERGKCRAGSPHSYQCLLGKGKQKSIKDYFSLPFT